MSISSSGSHPHHYIIDCLLSEVSGQLMAFNLLHSSIQGIVNKNHLKDFLEIWWNDCSQFSIHDIDFQKVKNSFYKSLGARPDLLCQSMIPRTTTNSGLGDFINIKKYNAFYQLVDPVQQGQLLPDPDTESSEDITVALNTFFGYDDFCDNVPLISMGLTHTKGSYWVCPASDVDDALYQDPDRIRDFLGLTFLQEDECLMVLRISSEYLSCHKGSNRATRPNPLDAGFYDGFKCLSDIGLSQGHDHESGYTIDFHKYASQEAIVDGGREFIVDESQSKPVRLISVKALGVTTETVEVDKSLVECFEKFGVKYHELKERLIELVA